MKIYWKKIAAMTMAIVTAAVISGCGDNTAQQANIKTDPAEYLNTESEFPIVKEPISLKVVGVKAATHGEWRNMAVFKKANELTNINMEFETYSDDIWAQKKALLLSGSNLPDILYSCLINAEDEISYGNNGKKILVPMQDYIRDYAPHLWNFIQSNERYRKTITASDGNIYSVGNYNPSDVRANVYYVNRTWLDKIGMPAPETTDDLYKVLKAFKEQDLSGSGEKDFLGLSAVGIDKIIELIGPAFLEPSDSNGYAIREGKVIYAPMEANYKEMLKYLKKLNDEGLIDVATVTQSRQELLQKMKDGRAAGILCDTPADAFSANPDENDKYEVLKPLTSEFNSTKWTLYSEDCGFGGFAITSANKYPEASVRWLDIWWRTKDEMVDGLYGESMSRGPVGETWNFTNEDRTEFAMNQDPSGQLTETLYRFKVAAPARGAYRSDTLRWSNYWLQVKADGTNENYFPYMVESFPVNVRYEGQDKDELSSIQADLAAYKPQMVAKFIMGQEDIDTGWDAYVKQIKNIGIERALKIQQKAYDNWNAVK